MNLSPRLSAEYAMLWSTLKPDTEDVTEGAPAMIASAATLVTSHRDRYQLIEKATGVPWAFVGVVHYREGSCNFRTHLHNGDSLQRRTVHVPSGRPVAGEPPFTWEESATDALRYEGLDRWKDWRIEALLYQLESYNGFGYRRFHEAILSPYLWSYSNHETQPGHYSDDGHWSADTWDEQIGAAVLLQAIITKGAFALKG